MRSVRDWAAEAGLGYRWLDDELFELLPAQLRPGGRITPVIAGDLARLLWAQCLLRAGEARQVLWLDADVLVFRPERLKLPDVAYAVGREHWVQRDGRGGWRCYRQVHNAALFFRGDADGRNSLLDFYADSAARLLRANQAAMPPQFIGPKLLTALHNVVQLPVMEHIGMISPGLAADLPGGAGGALAAYRARAGVPLAAANLCRSACRAGEAGAAHMDRLIQVLTDGVEI